MDAETLNNLKERANEIKVATEAGENTAVRVGGLLKDMLDYDQDQTEAIEGMSSNVLKQPLIGINQMNSSPTEGQSVRFRNNRWEFFVPGEGGGSANGRQASYFINVTHGTTPILPDTTDYVPADDKFVHGTDEWTRNSPNPGINEDTWMMWVWFSATAPLTISGPVLVRDSATASSNGEDGESIEWIYKRTPTKLSDAEILTLQEYLEGLTSTYDPAYAQEDARPSGWTDSPQGIDATNKYEYTAFRKSSLNAQGDRIWGVTGFVGPILWAAYGEKGTDGDGVEYIFYANNLGYIPMGADYDPTAWTNDPNFQDPEYIRTVEGTDIQYWKDDPIDLANSDLGQGAIEWVSIRKKQTINGVTSWQPYSTPAVWSRLAVDGLVEGYTVDLSNQNMPTGTDFNGHAANYTNSCAVTVYHNGVPMNYGTDPGEFSLSIGTITRSDNVAVNGHIAANLNMPSNPNDIIVTIDSTGIDDFDGKNAFIPVVVTIYEGQNQTTTRNLTITMYGVAVGEAGKVIDLYTETAAIHTDSSGTVIAPTDLDVGVRIGSGSDYQIKLVQAAVLEGYKFEYFYDDTPAVSPVENPTIQSSPFSPASNHTSLSIRMLKLNGSNEYVRIDEERLPYVKDGAQGAGLIRSTPYYHASTSSNSSDITPGSSAATGYWHEKIEDTGWSATNMYLYMQVKNTYTWGDDWVGTPDLFRTWIKDGQSSYKSTIFTRTNETPDAPDSSYGSFAQPSPPTETSWLVKKNGGTIISGVYWHDGIPAGDRKVWASTRIFTSDGQSPQQATWSTPRPMTDTDTYDVEFAKMQPNDGTPDPPEDGVNGNRYGCVPATNQVWFDPVLDSTEDFTAMYWRAERECINGEWGNWTILRIKGEKGTNGTDGWVITVNRGVLIVEQYLNNTDNPITIAGGVVVPAHTTYFILPINVTFRAVHGANAATITNVINRRDGQSYDGLTWAFPGTVARLTNITKVGDAYITNTYKGVEVTAQDSVTSETATINVDIPVYLNLMGTFQTEIEGDVETSVAHSLSYGYDGTYVQSLENIGTYIRSSEENIQELSKDTSVTANTTLWWNGITQSQVNTYWEPGLWAGWQSMDGYPWYDAQDPEHSIKGHQDSSTDNPAFYKYIRYKYLIDLEELEDLVDNPISRDNMFTLECVTNNVIYNGATYNFNFVYLLFDENQNYLYQGDAIRVGDSTRHIITLVSGARYLAVCLQEASYPAKEIPYTPASTGNATRYNIINTLKPKLVVHNYQGSIIKQLADLIRMQVGESGIDIEKRKITATADQFEWRDLAGNLLLGMDSNIAVFRGTVKAKNFYHNICVFVEQGTYSNGLNNTGEADLVYAVPNPYNNPWNIGGQAHDEYRTITLPSAKEYEGKTVELAILAPGDSTNMRNIIVNASAYTGGSGVFLYDIYYEDNKIRTSGTYPSVNFPPTVGNVKFYAVKYIQGSGVGNEYWGWLYMPLPSSGGGGVSPSGNYLPLSGGTLTGTLTTADSSAGASTVATESNSSFIAQGHAYFKKPVSFYYGVHFEDNVTQDSNFTATFGQVRKSGSSNSYVLLGGGGTKPLSEFAASADVTHYSSRSAFLSAFPNVSDAGSYSNKADVIASYGGVKLVAISLSDNVDQTFTIKWGTSTSSYPNLIFQQSALGDVEVWAVVAIDSSKYYLIDAD